MVWHQVRKEADRHPRAISLVVMGIIGIIGATAVTGVGLGLSREAEIREITKNLKAVKEVLETTALDLQGLSTRTLLITQRLHNVTMHAKEQLRTLYTIIERTRCVNQAKFKALETGLATHMYRTYLTDTMHHIMQAAITGKLYPSLIGMQELRKAIANHPALSSSLVSANPMLAYQFGRVIPVQLDFRHLRFGYLIELPAGSIANSYPLYRAYSIGFYHLEPSQRALKMQGM